MILLIISIIIIGASQSYAANSYHNYTTQSLKAQILYNISLAYNYSSQIGIYDKLIASLILSEKRTKSLIERKKIIEFALVQAKNRNVLIAKRNKTYNIIWEISKEAITRGLKTKWY